MAISFNCECCKKKVKAPDNAGGKWGACPHCRHRCYIPLPPSDDEPELKLVPLDENEESRYGEMMRETHTLTKNILRQTKMPEDDGRPVHDPIAEKELLTSIILYLRQMADAQLAQAEGTEKKLKHASAQVKTILKKMAKAERPEPELADIAPKVIQGFMKSLYAKL